MASEGSNPAGKPQDSTGYVLLHVFAGPAFGVLAVLLTTIPSFAIPAPIAVPDVGAVTLFLPVVFLTSWFFGFIPALLHAFTMIGLRRSIGALPLWLGLTPFVGALAVGVPLLLVAGMPQPDRASELIGPALVGSFAAICCQAVAWRRRMYPLYRAG